MRYSAALLILVFSLVFILCSNVVFGEEMSSTLRKPEASVAEPHSCKPVAPVVLVIEAPEQWPLDKALSVTVSMTSSVDAEDASISIRPEKGLVLESGELHWKGSVRSGVAVSVTACLKFAGRHGALVTASGGITFKNGNRLYRALEKYIACEDELMTGSAPVLSKTAVARSSHGITEVRGVER